MWLFYTMEDISRFIMCDVLSQIIQNHKDWTQAKSATDAADRVLPLRPKLIMMSASPSMMRVNSSGVTSLHTLKALKNASLMTSSSRSGVYPRILRGWRTNHRAGRGFRTFYVTLRETTESLEHGDKRSWFTKWQKKQSNPVICLPVYSSPANKNNWNLWAAGGVGSYVLKNRQRGDEGAHKTAGVSPPR